MLEKLYIEKSTPNYPVKIGGHLFNDNERIRYYSEYAVFEYKNSTLYQDHRFRNHSKITPPQALFSVILNSVIYFNFLKISE